MKNKIDLGKYDLTKLLLNPMTVHKIQDNLLAIKEDSFLANTIRDAAKTNIKECIKMIVSQYQDNPTVIKRIVGVETIKLIDEFEGTTIIDDSKDMKLFTK